MFDDDPAILRPIPRRPFASNLISATPPDDKDISKPPSPNPNANLDFSCLLPPSFNNKNAHSLGSAYSNDHLSNPSSALSRPASYRNLTTSALVGIFSSPSTSSFRDSNIVDSPGSVVDDSQSWDKGVETAIHRRGSEDSTLELVGGRSHLRRRGRPSPLLPSGHAIGSWQKVESNDAVGPSSLDLASRAALLFLIGVGYGAGYGAMMDRFQGATGASSSSRETRYNTRSSAFLTGQPAPTPATPDWISLTLWGFAGVFLGAALPWADNKWKATLAEKGGNGDGNGNGVERKEEVQDDGEAPWSDDWMSVTRPIAAFVGIVFAIRKLAWTSTLQVSLTLAATDPLLWWFIDRTATGFGLSAVLSISGSLLLLSIDPSAMAAPSGFAMFASGNISSNSAVNVAGDATDVSNDQVIFGGLASQKTLESGVWMASVLFCSCLCFGNIGRRLAQSSAGKGRQ